MFERGPAGDVPSMILWLQRFGGPEWKLPVDMHHDPGSAAPDRARMIVRQLFGSTSKTRSKTSWPTGSRGTTTIARELADGANIQSGT
jgi:hypothetical protein